MSRWSSTNRALTLIIAMALGATSSRADVTPPEPDASEAPLRDPSMLVRLIRSEAVKDDLALKSEQGKDVDALVADVEYPLFQLRDLPPKEKRDRINALADKIDASLKHILTPEQTQRLFEIGFRAHGWPALLAPEPAKALNLSAEQTADLRRILDEMAKSKANSIAPFEERILALLKPAQKTELTRLSGAPFDFSKVPQVASRAPELRDVTDWINCEPVTLAGLRGRVVAVHFFAFGCSNCVNNQPHYQAWHKDFADKKVTILGIHTPETKREREVANLAADVRARKIAYAVAVDNKSSNWAAWANHVWPSVYLIDKRGYVRYWWYGELNWNGAEGEQFMRKRIEELLAEAE